VVYQIITLAIVLGIGYYLISNAAESLTRKGIASGFSFLSREAGFDVGETLISHSARDTIAHTFLIGLLNTLYVSAIGIVLATVLGTTVGIARVSPNWLIAKLASVFVEIFRNVPILLQIMFWYTLTRAFPLPRQALTPIEGVFLSNRGINFPVPLSNPIHKWMLLAFIAGIVGSFLLVYWNKRRQTKTGRTFSVFWPCIALIVILPIIAWLIGGMPTAMNIPTLRGFNFTGGVSFSPELAALVVGLSVYSSSFIAEIVRSGINSVSIEQWDAARSLGLRKGQCFRLIVLPQALRVIVAPLTSQYLGLTKDSTLAVVIGYPDLVSVVNTASNQTGQAIEGIVIMMSVYLTISLCISAFMNWYNKRVALKGS
jgi:general L-amino acid transport system permease protein